MRERESTAGCIEILIADPTTTATVTEISSATPPALPPATTTTTATTTEIPTATPQR